MFQWYTKKQARFLLVSKQLGLDFATADIKPGYCSDHSLVDIAFKTNIVKRNRPFWKFNNSLLRDAVFVVVELHFYLIFFTGRNKFYDPMRHSGRSCLTEVERQFGAAPSARFVFLVKVLNWRN